MCGEWGSVVSCYGIGSDGESESDIGVDVAFEFQFDGHHRVADAVDVERANSNPGDTGDGHTPADVVPIIIVNTTAEGEGDDAFMQRRLRQRSRRGDAECWGSSLIPGLFGLFGLLRRLATVRLIVFRDRTLCFDSCGDGYLRGEWGTVIAYYGVGSNGESESGIGVDVAVKFQFDGDFRVAGVAAKNDPTSGYASDAGYGHCIPDIPDVVSPAAEGEGDDAFVQCGFGQWHLRGGDYGFRDCSDGYLCGHWGTVVFCYGVGSNGEGEGGIGVDVALEF